MSDAPYHRCACIQCGVNIEFPEELAGTSAACPSCKAPQELVPVFDEPQTPAPASAEDALSAASIVGAFGPPIPRPRVSILYPIGMTLVAGFMVLLPIVYVLLTVAAAYGVYLWASHGLGLFTSYRGGIRLSFFALAIYLAPLFAGLVLVLFMIKPLFARRLPKAQPLSMNPAAEPKLYAFIAKVCDTVGAPFPSRIDLDCDLNASAGFRRGFLSFFDNDLVLTIGLPLVAGLNLQQFAGVLAHEFGHFSQGWGMRLSYVISRINGWFARVVYQRDAWDVWLEGLAAEAESWGVLIVATAQLAVGLSRMILSVLMHVAHAVSCFMMRQMEYDADLYEIKVAGSGSFESTMGRLEVLGAVMKIGYRQMKNTHDIHHTLPENLPAFLQRLEEKQPAEARDQLVDAMGLTQTGVFDTHPSTGDRIRRARQAGSAGLFHLTAPAATLFSRFDIPAQQVTRDHYETELGIDFNRVKLAPLTGEPAEGAPHEPPATPARAPLKIPFKPRGSAGANEVS